MNETHKTQEKQAGSCSVPSSSSFLPQFESGHHLPLKLSERGRRKSCRLIPPVRLTKHNTSHASEIQKILGFQKCRLIGNLAYNGGMDDTGAIGQMLTRLIRRMDCLYDLLPQREVGTNKNVEVLSFLQHVFLL